MPTFIYKAKDGPARTVEGELVAEHESAALRKIEDMGYCPVSVTEKGGSEARGSLRAAFLPVRQRDINVFTHQLGSLIKAGVPILRALRTVREQTENARLNRVLTGLEAAVRDGRMLSEAMSAYPRVFSGLYVNMVRAGESAGILDTILLRLADALDKEEDVRSKVQSAMAYPLLVLVVGLVTVAFMLTVFLPRIAGLFRHYRELPLPTRLLIGMSDFCAENWLWILVPVVLLLVIGRRITAEGKGKLIWDGVALGLPLFGPFIKKAEIARFARVMSLLVDAGIPVESALALSADTVRNSILQDEIRAVRTRIVEQGASIAAGLKKAAHFPSFATSMVAVGEEGGSLDVALVDVAQFYERDVERQIGIVTALIEPLLILVVGALVGFIAFAMMLPIFTITQSIG